MLRRHSEMCGRGYFGVRIRRNTIRVRSCPTTGIRGRALTVNIQSYRRNFSNVLCSVTD